MKRTGKKSLLEGIPAWRLALMTMVLAFVVLMIVGDLIAAGFLAAGYWRLATQGHLNLNGKL